MNRRTISIFLVLLCFAGQAGNDSLLRFSDLDFRNAFEREIFRDLPGNKYESHSTDLFLTHFENGETYSSDDAYRQIKEQVEMLKKETRDLTEEKKVKLIYKKVHARFFKLYHGTNSFSDIFTRGEYNCVSSSALYALIFDLMKIPYQVIEEPGHVYLYAYPNSHKIEIQTTTPTGGYRPFSEGYTEKFVKAMGDGKIIPKQEMERMSTTELFNRYYFSNNGMNLQDLAAIQYANYAFYHLEKQENGKALPEAKKAYFLSPSVRTKYLLQNILLLELTNTRFSTERDFVNLALLCRFNVLNKKDASDELIKYEFNKLTYEVLVTDANYSLYDKAYNIVSASIGDSDLKKEIDFIYHYELARLGNNNHKSRDYEMPHLRAAYAINPKHEDLRSLVKTYFLKLADEDEDFSRMVKDIEQFRTDFSFIGEDGDFNQVHGNCLLEVAYQEFTLQNISRGENQLKQFEKLCTENPAIKPSEKYVEKAYSTAATYFYKKGNITRTREILKRGISYAPDNWGLQARLRQAN